MQRLVIKAIGLGLNLWSLVAPKQAAKSAARIFSTPPKPRVRPKEQQFLSTARQIRAEVAGQNIVAYLWGPEGAPLVLLSYGWAYNAGRWRHFVPDLLNAGFRVLAYDPPGHGAAPSGTLNIPLNAAIIRGLLDTYGPAYAIIGHSFGGSSSVYALQNMPLNMHPRRMVIMASFSFAPRVFKQYQQTLGIWPSLYWSMVRRFEQMVGHSIDHYDFAMMSAGFAHIEGLLVHDPADSVTPFEESRRYHDFWPGSYLYSAREGGHHLGTADITQSVVRFVQEGAVPVQAIPQDQPRQATHELARFFVGC